MLAFDTPSVGTGFKTDLEKVLKLFTETKTVRYEVFAVIWREMKLNFLCAGRQTEREAREFMEIVFEMTSRLWLPPSPFQSRVCALYLLYGFYMTQPCQPRVKIRMTLSEWLEVIAFMKTVEEQSHSDVSFVFHKLRAMNAFIFVAKTNEYYPQNKDGEADSDIAKDVVKEIEESPVRDLVSSDLVLLESVHNQYNSMKCTLAGPGATQPDRSLNLLNDNILLNIKTILQNFEAKRRAKHQHRGGTSGESSESDPERNSESIGDSRKRLRDRAYAHGDRPSKYGRHDPVPPPGDSDSPSGKGKGKRRGRMKWKKPRLGVFREDSEDEEGEEDNGTGTVVTEDSGAVLDDSGTVLDMPTLVSDEDNMIDKTSPASKRSLKSSPEETSKPSPKIKRRNSSSVSPKGKKRPIKKRGKQAKVSPSKAKLIKVSPSKASQIKVSPSKANVIKVSPAKTKKSKASSSTTKKADSSPCKAKPTKRTPKKSRRARSKNKS